MIFQGAVAVLTGSGRKNGVGSSIAELLAMKGCNILINCIKNKEQADKVAEICRNHGVDAQVFIGDLTDLTICQAMAEYVENRWGRTDIIVNCLGYTKGASYEDLSSLTSDDFDKMFRVNAIAPYLVVQAFQKMLKKSGDAAVVNISSAAGLTGKGSSIAYAASKGAENTLTLALAQALSPEVRVNAICPSFIDSSWWEETFKGREEQYKGLISRMKQGNLLNRVLEPVDVAKAVISVIDNKCMTGELIRLDAGAHVGKANPR